MNAPVVLFVYNRLDHVEKTLTALSNNHLAKESDIYIFSDGPKTDKDNAKVVEVRNYIAAEKWKQLFKSVTIISSTKNKGLANSIISGVTDIIDKNGRVIVIEDDCISSPDFLTFMNDCLDFYEESNNIWSIGGYTFNINYPNDYSYDIYLMGRTCSYAWATWKDRWDRVDWDVKTYSRFKYNFCQRKKFNEYGLDRSKMLDEQQLGIKNSWAIRFCYAMFENNMLTVYPRHTKIQNIGYTEGTHVNTKYATENPYGVVLDKEDHPYTLVKNLDVSEQIRTQFVQYFKRSRAKLFAAYICNVILKIKR